MGVTIKDVAKKAGVSIASVSRVINDSKPVAPETKEKILKVIKETGYKPNAMARGLKKNESGLIGLITPDMENGTFAELVKGIESVIEKNSMNLIVSNSKGEIERELRELHIFKEQQLDGIIFSGVKFTKKHKEYFDRYKVPTVVVSQKFPGSGLPYVDIDNFKAAYQAVDFLIKNNHQQIAMVRGPFYDKSAGKQRYNGYFEALKDAGLKVNSSFVKEGNFTIKSGYQAMEKILSENEMLPTAVFAASDRMAIGVLDCCLDNNLKVPEDISIIGFDDIELATVVRPKLTTVRVDHSKLGEKSVELLLNKIKKNKDSESFYEADFEIIERETVKKLT
ncbi:LacI family DNA-binding transcriptional regulator [Halanaerobium sp. ST460_2HS_T2]|uniref:LacI family DNA-binding transcriptional regulator n=1 Tax=Halanaerobium sp. ST460_2HS_T2 TaxID=2183914 RepID=UPI000DF2B2AB|nr:LacI family DNA-binding transcriptional regulator [Halanaerobium sp. ST460_2HS_T2]RCW56199.1 LacI family transcriptional regulator [Halanaerobium sp. ST460_2HS_T2]